MREPCPGPFLGVLVGACLVRRAAPPRETTTGPAGRGVPPAFTFVFKAPQRITHFSRLKDVDEPVRAFCDAVWPARDPAGLVPQLGYLLFVGRRPA